MDEIDDKQTRFLLGVSDRIEEVLHVTRKRRGLAHFRLTDACRESGESVRSLYRIKNRENTSVRSLVRLACALGVTVRWLVAGDIDSIEWDTTEEASSGHC